MQVQMRGFFARLRMTTETYDGNGNGNGSSSNGDGNSNDNSNSRSLRDDKQATRGGGENYWVGKWFGRVLWVRVRACMRSRR
jgi:hypothetical protein